MHRNPANYELSNSFEKYLLWSNEKKVVFDEIKINLKNSSKMLDIGAGNGELTLKFSPYFSEITVVEPAKKFIKHLKEFLPNSNIIPKGFEDIDFEDKFDFILASHSLYFLKHINLQLNRIRDILSDHGIFVVVHKDTEGDFARFLARFRKDIVGDKYPNSTSPKELIKTIQNARFKVHERKVCANVVIPSADDLVSILDFLYSIEFDKIENRIKNRIRIYLKKRFKNSDIIFKKIQSILFCSKQ